MTRIIDLYGQPIISDCSSPYLIAEIGTNHNQDIRVARNLVEAVAEAGFDCAKFQTYEAHEIVGKNVLAKDYGLDRYYGDISAEEMFEKHLKTPKEWFPELRELCRECGIHCATTIHGAHGLKWAQDLGFDLIKVASMDHTNRPFLRSLVNAISSPILASFGMAKLADIDAAVEILRPHTPGIAILHCVSIYPPRPEELRLANIAFLRERFPVPVGFSDHADDVITSLAALSLGSRLFEKHVTLDKKGQGPDHPFALEPDQMKSYVSGLRILAEGLDSKKFQSPTHEETAIRSAYLKSIVLARDLPAGTTFKVEDFTMVRPGTGIPPSDLFKIIGRTSSRSLQTGDILTWNDMES